MLKNSFLSKAILGSAVAFVAQSSMAQNYNLGQLDTAQTLYTGSPNLVYFNNFAPPVTDYANSHDLHVSIEKSDGSSDNIKKVAADPTALGFAQGDDLLDLQLNQPDVYAKLHILGSAASECMFLVTSPKYKGILKNIGDVLKAAKSMGPALTVAVGPEGAGARKSWNIIAAGNPLSQATLIPKSTGDSLADIASGKTKLGFFTVYPVPTNATLMKIQAAGLAYVPVAVPQLSKLRVNDQLVYEVREGISSPVVAGGEMVPTTCMPTSLIANKDASALVFSTFTPSVVKSLSPRTSTEDKTTIALAKTKALWSAGTSLMSDVISSAGSSLSQEAQSILQH